MSIPPEMNKPEMNKKDHPHWKRMQFKGNKVWVAVDAAEKPLLEAGKHLIKYQLEQPHEYWVNPSKVLPLGEKSPKPTRRKLAPASKRSQSAGENSPVSCSDENTICIYTDGACSGNPGPAGIGVVMQYKGNLKEISRYLGIGTNNIAELEAIRAGLLAVKNRKLPVIVFTDSSYSLGLLTKGWKAKQNQALVADIRELVATFKQVSFVKVKGHSGHPQNERADRLAVESLKGK